MRTARELRIGRVRVFLLWPWIEASRGTFDFGLWDAVFDEAEKHEIGVAATLTANSGPWWLGTPDVLHSFTRTLSEDWRDAMSCYVRQCVDRYRDSPALAQWVLWNEPQAPAGTLAVGPPRAEGDRQRWAAVLNERYDGDVAALNERYRSGYASFSEVPFLESLAHPLHAGSHWRNLASAIDDSELRPRSMVDELGWLAARVRESDPVTPLCVNPSLLLQNLATSGYTPATLSHHVDVLGASFHAPWSFAFAERTAHIPLIVTGTTFLRRVPGHHRTEVTEVQFGNTFLAGRTPMGITPGQILSSVLAPALAGADSVTGWCLNARRHDFEAGEWGLLEDDDSIGPRAQAAGRAADILTALEREIGPWQPVDDDVWVVQLLDAHRVEHAQALTTTAPGPSHALQQTAPGGALLTVELLRMGAAVSHVPGEALSGPAPRPSLVIAANQTAWSVEAAGHLLEHVATGGQLLMDGFCGQFDPDVRRYSPWPGVLAEAFGVRSRGILTHPDAASWRVLLHGAAAGLVGARSDLAFDEARPWRASEILRLDDGIASPLLWSCPVGKGTVHITSCSLTDLAMQQTAPARAALRTVLTHVTSEIPRPVRPLTPATITLRVQGDNGTAVGVFGPDLLARGGAALRIGVGAGDHRDLVTGMHLRADGGEIVLPAPDGVGLLVSPRP